MSRIRIRIWTEEFIEGIFCSSPLRDGTKYDNQSMPWRQLVHYGGKKCAEVKVRHNEWGSAISAYLVSDCVYCINILIHQLYTVSPSIHFTSFPQTGATNLAFTRVKRNAGHEYHSWTVHEYSWTVLTNLLNVVHEVHYLLFINYAWPFYELFINGQNSLTN